MRGERCALRAGEFLVWLACRRLPARIRQERYQEWLAELPVILRDRDTGSAPVRVVRMLAFAADTLRGTALAADAYHGAHRGRGTAAKDLRWLGTGLLLLGALLGCVLALLADEGWIIYHLAAAPDLPFSVTLALSNLGLFAGCCIARRGSPTLRWYIISKIAVGAGLSVRAIASSSGWGHPLLFAIISYGGCALSAACLGLAVRYLSRPHHAGQGPGQQPG
jgi:hypothetical protein